MTDINTHKTSTPVKLDTAKNATGMSVEVKDFAYKKLMQGMMVKEVSVAIRKEFGIRAEDAMRYARLTMDDIYDTYRDGMQEAAERNWRRLEQLYREAAESDDRKMQLEIIREQNRMCGVYAETPIINQVFEIKFQ